MFIRQTNILNHSYKTLVEMKLAANMVEGDLCTCIETSTTYRYLTLGSALTADDKMVVVTSVGGNTRWVGVAGTYGFYGTTTDYTKFEADGTLVAVGGAICYRDEYVGGTWFVPNGATGPTVTNATIGGVVTQKYGFVGTGVTVQKLGNSFEIPHDIAVTQINAGTLPIELHVHFGPNTTGTGNVRWVVDWCLNKVSGAVAIAGTQLVFSKNIPSNQQYYNLLVGGNLAVPAGGFTIGDLIEFTLSRDPADVGDTYAADALLYQVALHVPVDTLGSRTTYTK